MGQAWVPSRLAYFFTPFLSYHDHLFIIPFMLDVVLCIEKRDDFTNIKSDRYFVLVLYPTSHIPLSIKNR